VSALFIAAHAHASFNLRSLEPRTGLYSANSTAVLADPYWSILLLSSSGPPPDGIPSGTAYLVSNNIGFPFGYWLPNDSASSWPAHSIPTQAGGDVAACTYQYQLTFIAAKSGVANVSWLSDNADWLCSNGSLIGSRGSVLDDGSDHSRSESWNTPIALNLTAEVNYIVDLDVFNAPQEYGNPTDGRAKLTEDVSVVPDFDPSSAVPEPGTLICGALLLLPFGATAIRILRCIHPRNIDGRIRVRRVSRICG